MKFRTHNLHRACALALTCLSASAAWSIPSYSLARLPDAGFGGEALGLQSGGPWVVVGSIRNSAGGTDAAAWHWNAGSWDMLMLPGQGGKTSQAVGGWFDETSLGTASLIVGQCQDGSGLDNANIWTSANGASPTRRSLPTLGGANGRAVGVRRCISPLCGGYIVVGDSQIPGGATHATLWHVAAGSAPEAFDLGTLGGANSEASACFDDQFGGTIYVVGRSQTSTGAWHACSWSIPSHEAMGNPTIQDRHPGGIASAFGPLAAKGGGEVAMEELQVVGSARTANGRTAAGICDLTAGDAWTALDSPATSNLASAIALTQYGSLVFGQAWDNINSQTPVVWNTNRALGQTSVYALDSILDGPAAGGPVSFTAAGPGIVTGRLRIDGLDDACTLVTNGNQLPDAVTVPLGTPENNFSETDLWRANDGRTLRIRARQGFGVVVGCKYEVSEFDAAKNVVAVHTRARVDGSANVSATIRAELWDFSKSQWVTAGQFVEDRTYDEEVWSPPAGSYADPATGEVRARLTATPLTGKLLGMEADSLVITFPESH